ncbi:hypothetical protein VTK73DRAFT_7281 [Phialemonium thermophilum]|uniref:Uncharacterized protein n=1 Tax=Phialemonium thermophilum TaxID=223376 RepID=A0ABR3WFM0_9PEZI
MCSAAHSPSPQTGEPSGGDYIMGFISLLPVPRPTPSKAVLPICRSLGPEQPDPPPSAFASWASRLGNALLVFLPLALLGPASHPA